jgi:hypothetical protein
MFYTMKLVPPEDLVLRESKVPSTLNASFLVLGDASSGRHRWKKKQQKPLQAHQITTNTLEHALIFLKCMVIEACIHEISITR